MASRPLEVIAMFTRRTQQMLETSPGIFDGHLDVISTYNNEGLEKIRAGDTMKKSRFYRDDELKRLEALFNYNLGFTARAKYYEQLAIGIKDEASLQRWYYHMKTAADMMGAKLTRKTAMANGYAAEAAILLVKNWRERAIECSNRAIQEYERSKDSSLADVAKRLIEGRNLLGSA
ncbi:hypothetical protein HY637_04965 [Candidatus Woesearchaeota archaeon]|nr:hypothetical protein [Candidatus Woesearchaeota archaeon]